MRSFALTAFAFLFAAGCGKPREASKDSVDTAMVFIGAQSPPGDSVAWGRARDSVFAAVAAYKQGRISADSAAIVMMSYLKRSQRPLNMQMDDSLRAAVRRHM